MTRDEAVRLARAYWGEGDPHFRLREDQAEYRGGNPQLYGMADEPHWSIPLERTRLAVGSTHSVVVIERTGAVRRVQWGE